jgi:hypothetical protein
MQKNDKKSKKETEDAILKNLILLVLMHICVHVYKPKKSQPKVGNQVVLNAWNMVAPWWKRGVTMFKKWWHHGECDTVTSLKKVGDTATLRHVGAMWLADWWWWKNGRKRGGLLGKVHHPLKTKYKYWWNKLFL